MCKKFTLKNLKCSNCASKMEEQISKINGVQSVSINFITTKMKLNYDESMEDEILNRCQSIISKIEPNTIMEIL
ncbi:MAG: heavy metal-associated domain-containing protein [Campylobacter sputorum]|uniref:heavy-metal-associated domain-containing protein n=1 Tax=Campylobacter sputorum TaxID=206 RepID=UPI000B771768|nr:heavy metal-associated domain-containing protein [Campylobacter sputorum]ASM37775.1 heavy metal-associated domain protein [Campylobacter sputorum bv. paraureolyticus LMG 11764]MDY6119927.1 heavy metal-associated domain-containing protein [Campylobacter sputorum]